MVLDAKHWKSVNIFWVRSCLRRYREFDDDVFRDEFLQGVIFLSDRVDVVEVDVRAQKYLTDMGATWIGTMSGEKTGLRAGPHIELGGILTPVLRVFDDTHGAFVHAVRKDDNG